MAKRGKKYRAVAQKVDNLRRYSLDEAVQLVKDTKTAKFNESVDVAINLGVDPRHADQLVRGTVVLPHGTGKTLRVAVFAKGQKAQEAEAAGADVVGAEDLAAKVEAGFMDFDKVIASPDMMAVVGKLGKVLGPRGLMPNPKLGTVTVDVASAVRDVKAGKIEFKVDKQGILHTTVGRAAFSSEQLSGNMRALFDAVSKAKPNNLKGQYVRKITVATTMGPGIKLDISQFAAAALAE